MNKTTSGIINIEEGTLTVSGHVEAGTLTVLGQATFLDGVRSIVNYNFYTSTTSSWPRDVYTRILNWTPIQTSGQILTYSNGFFTNNIGYGVYVSVDFSGRRAAGAGDSNYRIVGNSVPYNQHTVSGQDYACTSSTVYLPSTTSFFVEGLHASGSTQAFDDCRLTYIIHH